MRAIYLKLANIYSHFFFGIEDIEKLDLFLQTKNRKVFFKMIYIQFIF